ncbi:nucleoside ABC transporter membrane protein [Halogeometricum borinquense DSM 11551]|uniref:Nucleoside ABC transporter membrane protein n=2 Tax=Halogeometricum borinquense TaxID=60847 RepID=E4NMZ0_HALBP|nr:ABC transporter permease [Halogeometricum borinquense]ADQ67402.1 nucleoside ABC transporter membrane protein [Halogeometricum borinquense DSM 11551]ELY28614.1 nucleoside ABC transporter membrane protein [Halogeometricum borinquense DSM 11551]RYJ13596.1 ABC transporter permease [Halogeometricum borinquense]
MSTITDARRTARSMLRRLVALSGVERLLISLAALVLAIFVGAGLILVSGRITTCSQAAAVYFGTGFCYDPTEVFFVLFNGAFGNPLNPKLLTGPLVNPSWNPLHGPVTFSGPLVTKALFTAQWNPLNFSAALTLKETTLLVFTGLSVAVAFRAGLFNIGTQGQLVIGGLVTALVVGILVPVVPGGFAGSILLIPVGTLAGAAAGGLYAAIPGALKAYADANEVITTIMLNFIAAKLAYVAVSEFFKNPDSQVIETAPLPDYATLGSVVFPQGSDFSILSLLFALLLVIGIWYLIERTSYGFDLRTSGIQPEAAEYGGVDAKRTVVTSMMLSGALGGIGGAMWVLMVMGKWQTGVPSLGFDGITVSILAGNNPLGAIPAALLFGTLKSGSLAVQFNTGVPKQLVGVLRGLIILFVAMPEFFRAIGTNIVDLEEPDQKAVATDGGRSVSTEGGDE